MKFPDTCRAGESGTRGKEKNEKKFSDKGTRKAEGTSKRMGTKKPKGRVNAMKTIPNQNALHGAGQPAAEPLSPLESALFMWMKLHEGDILTRETLLKNVWGFKSIGETRTVDMCVRRLRKKIGAERIKTVHGKGYLMLS